MDKFNFQPLDPILYKAKDGTEKWLLRVFSHYGESDKGHKRVYTTTGWFSVEDYDVIPFNDETRHLLGTKDPAPKHLGWEPEPGDLVAVRNKESDRWKARVFVRINEQEERAFMCDDEVANLSSHGWKFCEPARDHFKIPEA
jgi:hypothetical protein